MNTDLDLYDDFVDGSPQGSVFCKSWWLKTVAPDSWDILTVENNGHLQAASPIIKQRSILGDRVISEPPLTPYQGIMFMDLSDLKMETQISRQRKWITQIIDQLPDFDYYKVNYHHSFNYWLPLYWQGFNQTTRYTYIIDDLSDLDMVWNGFRENIRREIRKAQKKQIKVTCSDDLQEFWDLNQKTFDRQGVGMIYDLEYLRRIDDICKQKGCRKIFFAVDDLGKIHAASYVIWDKHSAYYLLGGGDPQLRTSGAASLIMWESIRAAAGVSKAFNFEGSMIKPVERFFSAFGAKPYPYYAITKPNSLLRSFKYAFDTFRRSL